MGKNHTSFGASCKLEKLPNLYAKLSMCVYMESLPTRSSYGGTKAAECAYSAVGGGWVVRGGTYQVEDQPSGLEFL